MIRQYALSHSLGIGLAITIAFCCSALAADTPTDLASSADVQAARAKGVAHVRLLGGTDGLVREALTIRTLEQLVLHATEDLQEDTWLQVEKHAKLRRVVFIGLDPVPQRLFRALGKSASVKELEIHASQGITDEVIHAMAQVGALEVVRIGNCGEVTSNGFGSLAALKNLAILDVGDNELDDDKLRAAIPTPEYSKLASLRFWNCRGLSNVGMEIISRLPSLRSLTLHNCTQVGNVGLAKLTNCRHLRDLSLSGNSAIDAAPMAECLEKLQLEELSLSRMGGWEVSPLALVSKASLSKLRRLHLHHVAGTDGSIGDLAHQAAKLEVLSLSGADLWTDALLRKMLAHPTLRDVNVVGAEAITAGVVPDLLRNEILERILFQNPSRQFRQAVSSEAKALDAKKLLVRFLPVHE